MKLLNQQFGAGYNTPYVIFNQLRFKQIFKDAWYDFIQDHPRYNNDYYKNEVNKMLNCSCSEGGFAKYKCTTCGQCEHTVHMSCKGKVCPQCGKRYARDSMVKIASKLFKGITYPIPSPKTS